MVGANMLASLKLWRDRRGRLSGLRIITLGLLMTPIALAIAASNEIRFSARPINDLIHRAGYWALLFVLLALAITPLRRIARFGQLADVRRLIWSRRTNDEPSPWMLLGLTLVVSALTFVFEAIGIGIAFSVSPLMVLQTAFDFDLEALDIRPGWLVLGAGVGIVALDIVRAWWRRPASRKPRPEIRRERAKPIPASNF